MTLLVNSISRSPNKWKINRVLVQSCRLDRSGSGAKGTSAGKRRTGERSAKRGPTTGSCGTTGKGLDSSQPGGAGSRQHRAHCQPILAAHTEARKSRLCRRGYTILAAARCRFIDAITSTRLSFLAALSLRCCACSTRSGKPCRRSPAASAAAAKSSPICNDALVGTPQ